MGLRIKQIKNKIYDYKSESAKQSENVTTVNYMFGVVQPFKYPGSSISSNNNISKEIKKQILISNNFLWIKGPVTITHTFVKK
jgi:hypothetical protein